jgi:hypothetical protein
MVKRSLKRFQDRPQQTPASEKSLLHIHLQTGALHCSQFLAANPNKM